MVRFPRLALTAALLLVLTGLAPGSAADEPTPGDPGRTGDPGNSAQAPGQEVAAERAAEQALEQAQALFGETETPSDGAEEPEAPEQAETPDGRDATMVLRDLAVALPDLSGSERREARRILARPTEWGGSYYEPKYDANSEVGRVCSSGDTKVCVHWVERQSDENRVQDDDNNVNTVPDYVNQALTVLTQVGDSYAAAGYRAPKTDGRSGDGPELDVYLADTAVPGNWIYGYCAPEGSYVDYREHVGTSGYCVLDNDFKEFSGSQLNNLKVTAAHEYFHAIQFGYDVNEDVWLMEASSTWAETQLYPEIKDNLQYLGNSPLSAPGTPLDTGNSSYYYGAWIFLQHLTERWPDRTGQMATVVKEIWDGADTVGKAPDEELTGVQAVQAALRERGSSWRKLLPEFGAANRRPAASYARGRADDYPRAPLAGRAKLSQRRPSDSRTLRPQHLTTATTAYVPTRSLRRRGWKLRLRFDLPRPGSAALVTVVPRRGEPTTTRVTLRRGDGGVRVPFSKRRVRSVEVTLANADTRYVRCGRGSVENYSCYGDPVGDRFRNSRWIGPRYAVRATAVRR